MDTPVAATKEVQLPLAGGPRISANDTSGKIVYSTVAITTSKSAVFEEQVAS